MSNQVQKVVVQDDFEAATPGSKSKYIGICVALPSLLFAIFSYKTTIAMAIFLALFVVGALIYFNGKLEAREANMAANEAAKKQQLEQQKNLPDKNINQNAKDNKEAFKNKGNKLEIENTQLTINNSAAVSLDTTKNNIQK